MARGTTENHGRAEDQRLFPRVSFQVNEFVKGTEEHHVAIQNQHEL